MSEEFTGINEEVIRRRVGATALEEGYRYMYSQALSGLQLQGNVLKANCKGHAGKVYRVQVQLGEKDILDAGCTCPQGMSGRCRHVAALVLTWLNRGENFQHAMTTHEILERLSRKELEQVFETIVQRRPDVQSILERNAPESTWQVKTLEQKQYRSIVESLLITENAGENLWDAIDSLKLMAEDFIRQREWDTTTDILASIYQAIRQRYPRGLSLTADEICSDCVADLMRIPGQSLDEQHLRLAGDVLFAELDGAIEIQGTLLKDIVRWMAEMGTTQVQAWAAQAWDSMHRCNRKAQRRLWGMLCLIFYGDKLDPGTQKKLYQEIGWFAELAQILAIEKNFEQISEHLQIADDYEVIMAADRLMQMNYPRQAITIVEFRFDEKPSEALEDWLTKHKNQISNDQEAIELARRMFTLRPDKESYHRLRTEGLRAGCWDDLQNECFLQLRKDEQWELLMELFIEDWDLERAVYLWQEAPIRFPRTTVIRIAQIAETPQPATAIKIYQELLESQLQELIDAKIANAQAAGENVRRDIDLLVARLKELITRVYGSQAWTEYLKSLRNRDFSI